MESTWIDKGSILRLKEGGGGGGERVRDISALKKEKWNAMKVKESRKIYKTIKGIKHREHTTSVFIDRGNKVWVSGWLG